LYSITAKKGFSIAIRLNAEDLLEGDFFRKNEPLSREDRL